MDPAVTLSSTGANRKTTVLYEKSSGIIPFRRGEDGVEYLLLHSGMVRNPDAAWEFPKGSMELGEDEPETARRELMEEYRGQGRIQTTAEVDAEIAADEVRLGALLRDQNEQIAQNTVGRAPDPLWGDRPGDIEKARGRNTEYLKMEIRKVREELAPVAMSEPVKEQMIAERERIIRRAAREDRLASRIAPRKRRKLKPVDPEVQAEEPVAVARSAEKAGPAVQKVLKQRQQFVKAVTYVATPWWRAKDVKGFKTKGKAEKAAKLLQQTAGSTIATQIRNQSERIKTNVKTLLKKKSAIGKYSLTDRSPEEVEAAIQKNPFVQVKPDNLRKIALSYKMIVVDATAAEAKTPEYSAAQRLQSIVEGVIRQIEDEQTLSGSMVPRGTRFVDKKPGFTAPMAPEPGLKRAASVVDAPISLGKRPKMTTATGQPVETPEKMEEILPGMTEQELQALTASGLSKKPRKRVKRRKSRQKASKKRAGRPGGGVPAPKTGLQKWHSQRKVTRRMRL